MKGNDYNLSKDISLKVGDYLKQLKKDYRKSREPVNFSFRSTCNQWLKRSDTCTHMIHSYPAKLVPYIPAFFLFNPAYKDKSGFLLDPFAGTGTVLLESVIHPYHRMNALGVEINPLPRLISKVKTTPLDTKTLKNTASALLSAIKQSAGKCEIPDFPNISFWFKKKAQKELARIKQSIDHMEDSDYKDFFWVCFSSIIRQSSLADPKVAPPVMLKEIVYSDKKQSEAMRRILKEKQNPKPIKYFEEEIEKNIRRMEAFCNGLENKKIKAKIVWDNATTLAKGKYEYKGNINKSKVAPLSDVDLVITSPPYINAQKYVRSLRLELFWLNFVDNDGLVSLDRQLIGTERIQQKTYKKVIHMDEPLADSTVEKIYKINERRAGIVSNFYIEMLTFMKQLYKAMNIGGQFILVVGNNMVFNERIQNHQILTNLATKHVGFDLEFIARDEIVSRGLMTKRHPTSGIIPEEWVIVLKKV